MSRDKYDATFIEDSISVLNAFLVLLPIACFWASYDQMGTTWVYQAELMKHKVSFFGYKWTILSDQMGLINSIFVLCMIPLFDKIIYRLFPMSSLTKIVIGCFVAVIGSASSALLQFYIGAMGTFESSASSPNTLVCTAGCMHILWQSVPYFIMTCAEILISITGLEVAYAEAPKTMKSVCTALYLLTVSAGNALYVAINQVNPVGFFKPKDEMAWNFVLWTGILFISAVIQIYLSSRHKSRVMETTENKQ